MANKYRKKQVKAPYRRFQGKGENSGENSAAGSKAGELVYLGYSKKKVSQYSAFTTPAIPFKLPLEILHLIVAYVQATDAANLLLVSKMWHVAALPAVYRAPELNPVNFAQFLDAINSHKELCSMVRDLDLSRTIQTGRNSWTAKILRKCSDNLLRFVSAQTNFGFSPLMALRTCKNLRILDLAYVSDNVNLDDLMAAVKGCDDLEVMRFPRKGTFYDNCDFEWPAHVHTLTLSGSLSSNFLLSVPLPPYLTSLEFQNCKEINDTALLVALTHVGPKLRSLAVHYPMPNLSAQALDTLLVLCPSLNSLRVSIEYVSCSVFDEEVAAGHPLRQFSLHASGSVGLTEKLKPEDILYATDYLVNLSLVRLSIVLGWNSKTDEMVDELAEVLDERGGGLYIA